MASIVCSLVLYTAGVQLLKQLPTLETRMATLAFLPSAQGKVGVLTVEDDPDGEDFGILFSIQKEMNIPLCDDPVRIWYNEECTWVTPYDLKGLAGLWLVLAGLLSMRILNERDF